MGVGVAVDGSGVFVGVDVSVGVSVGISGVSLGNAEVGINVGMIFIDVAEGSGDGVTFKVGVELGTAVGTLGT